MTQNETISFLDIRVNVFMQSCLAQGRCWLVTSHELGIFLRRHSHWLVSLTPSPHCQDLVNKRVENMKMGNNRSLIEEDNDGAVTWQIGFITQQSPRVMQTSQSHVCVTLAVTGRLVALQADNKCVSSHYRAGNPANSPRGWVTSGLVSTWSHNPSHRHSHSLTYHFPGGCGHRFKGLPTLHFYRGFRKAFSKFLHACCVSYLKSHFILIKLSSPCPQ